ncbi:MoaD/ThiS family protein [Agromyces sp. SYSU T0242]|uniref:MoaD/ThiS family protein n=1 Tax=Agromyces litoreus TaxID=3158561 RepID=UPI00339ACBE6
MAEPGTLERTVLVRYFAAAAEAAGTEEEQVVVDGDASTVGDLRDLLAARYGAPMVRVLANGSFLVDGVVRRDPSTPIGARVDVLPPFAGG